MIIEADIFILIMKSSIDKVLLIMCSTLNYEIKAFNI